MQSEQLAIKLQNAHRKIVIFSALTSATYCSMKHLKVSHPAPSPAPAGSTDDAPMHIEQVDTNPEPVEDLKRKISKAQQEEMTGSIEFRVVNPDKTDESMILLTGLKNIYQKQLPNMPKEYIARLVYDRYSLFMELSSSTHSFSFSFFFFTINFKESC